MNPHLLATETYFREQRDEQRQGDSRRDLEAERESPLEDGTLVILLKLIGDNRCHQGADTETELLKCGETASNRRMGDFGLVKRCQQGELTDTETCKESMKAS